MLFRLTSVLKNDNNNVIPSHFRLTSGGGKYIILTKDGYTRLPQMFGRATMARTSASTSGSDIT